MALLPHRPPLPPRGGDGCGALWRAQRRAEGKRERIVIGADCGAIGFAGLPIPAARPGSAPAPRRRPTSAALSQRGAETPRMPAARSHSPPRSPRGSHGDVPLLPISEESLAVLSKVAPCLGGGTPRADAALPADEKSPPPGASPPCWLLAEQIAGLHRGLRRLRSAPPRRGLPPARPVSASAGSAAPRRSCPSSPAHSQQQGQQQTPRAPRPPRCASASRRARELAERAGQLTHTADVLRGRAGPAPTQRSASEPRPPPDELPSPATRERSSSAGARRSVEPQRTVMLSAAEVAAVAEECREALRLRHLAHRDESVASQRRRKEERRAAAARAALFAAEAERRLRIEETVDRRRLQQEHELFLVMVPAMLREGELAAERARQLRIALQQPRDALRVAEGRRRRELLPVEWRERLQLDTLQHQERVQILAQERERERERHMERRDLAAAERSARSEEKREETAAWREVLFVLNRTWARCRLQLTEYQHRHRDMVQEQQWRDRIECNQISGYDQVQRALERRRRQQRDAVGRRETAGRTAVRAEQSDVREGLRSLAAQEHAVAKVRERRALRARERARLVKQPPQIVADGFPWKRKIFWTPDTTVSAPVIAVSKVNADAVSASRQVPAQLWPDAHLALKVPIPYYWRSKNDQEARRPRAGSRTDHSRDQSRAGSVALGHEPKAAEAASISEAAARTQRAFGRGETSFFPDGDGDDETKEEWIARKSLIVGGRIVLTLETTSDGYVRGGDTLDLADDFAVPGLCLRPGESEDCPEVWVHGRQVGVVTNREKVKQWFTSGLIMPSPQPPSPAPGPQGGKEKSGRLKKREGKRPQQGAGASSGLLGVPGSPGPVSPLSVPPPSPLAATKPAALSVETSLVMSMDVDDSGSLPGASPKCDPLQRITSDGSLCPQPIALVPDTGAVVSYTLRLVRGVTIEDVQQLVRGLAFRRASGPAVSEGMLRITFSLVLEFNGTPGQPTITAKLNKAVQVSVVRPYLQLRERSVQWTEGDGDVPVFPGVNVLPPISHQGDVMADDWGGTTLSVRFLSGVHSSCGRDALMLQRRKTPLGAVKMRAPLPSPMQMSMSTRGPMSTSTRPGGMDPALGPPGDTETHVAVTLRQITDAGCRLLANITQQGTLSNTDERMPAEWEPTLANTAFAFRLEPGVRSVTLAHMISHIVYRNEAVQWLNHSPRLLEVALADPAGDIDTQRISIQVAAKDRFTQLKLDTGHMVMFRRIIGDTCSALRPYLPPQPPALVAAGAQVVNPDATTFHSASLRVSIKRGGQMYDRITIYPKETSLVFVDPHILQDGERVASCRPSRTVQHGIGILITFVKGVAIGVIEAVVRSVAFASDTPDPAVQSPKSPPSPSRDRQAAPMAGSPVHRSGSSLTVDSPPALPSQPPSRPSSPPSQQQQSLSQGFGPGSLVQPGTVREGLRHVELALEIDGSDPVTAVIKVKVTNALLSVPPALQTCTFLEDSDPLRICHRFEVLHEAQLFDGGALEVDFLEGYEPRDTLELRGLDVAEVALGPLKDDPTFEKEYEQRAAAGVFFHSSAAGICNNSSLCTLTSSDPMARESTLADSKGSVRGSKRKAITRKVTTAKGRGRGDALTGSGEEKRNAAERHANARPRAFFREVIANQGGTNKVVIGTCYQTDARILILFKDASKDPSGKKTGTTVRKRDVQALLKGIHYQHKGDNPKELKKVVRVTLNDGRSQSCCTLHVVNVQPINDATEVARTTNRPLLYRQGSPEDHWGFTPFDDVVLSDPDTENFADGYLSIEQVSGGTYGSDRASEVLCVLPLQGQRQRECRTTFLVSADGDVIAGADVIGRIADFADYKRRLPLADLGPGKYASVPVQSTEGARLSFVVRFSAATKLPLKTVEELIHVIKYRNAAKKVKTGTVVFTVKVGAGEGPPGKLKVPVKVAGPLLVVPDGARMLHVHEGAAPVVLAPRIQLALPERHNCATMQMCVTLHDAEPGDALGLNFRDSPLQFKLRHNVIMEKHDHVGEVTEQGKHRIYIDLSQPPFSKCTAKHLQALLRCITVQCRRGRGGKKDASAFGEVSMASMPTPVATSSPLTTDQPSTREISASTPAGLGGNHLRRAEFAIFLPDAQPYTCEIMLGIDDSEVAARVQLQEEQLSCYAGATPMVLCPDADLAAENPVFRDPDTLTIEVLAQTRDPKGGAALTEVLDLQLPPPGVMSAAALMSPHGTARARLTMTLKGHIQRPAREEAKTWRAAGEQLRIAEVQGRGTASLKIALHDCSLDQVREILRSVTLHCPELPRVRGGVVRRSVNIAIQQGGDLRPAPPSQLAVELLPNILDSSRCASKIDMTSSSNTPLTRACVHIASFSCLVLTAVFVVAPDEDRTFPTDGWHVRLAASPANGVCITPGAEGSSRSTVSLDRPTDRVKPVVADMEELPCGVQLTFTSGEHVTNKVVERVARCIEVYVDRFHNAVAHLRVTLQDTGQPPRGHGPRNAHFVATLVASKGAGRRGSRKVPQA